MGKTYGMIFYTYIHFVASGQSPLRSSNSRSQDQLFRKIQALFPAWKNPTVWQDRNGDMLLTRAQLRGLQGRDTLVGHIERTGCTIAGTPLWTAGELAALRLHYPDKEALTAALPRRSERAIAHKARKCGLVPPLRIWTDVDAAQLRRPYVAGVPVTTLTEMFPGKSKRQIWGKAFAMGYRRPRRPPKPTGVPLIDSIRARAFDLRMTMTELDSFVARKRYFVSPRHMDWTALQRAMILLGGTPVVQWREP